MKKNYSHKPSKQRKRQREAPLHIKRKFLTAPLSPGLVDKYGVKRTVVRSGDKVLVMRGSYLGIEGQVTKVDTKKTVIYIDGVIRKKADGTEIPVPIHPSK